MPEKPQLISKGDILPPLKDFLSVIDHNAYIERMLHYTGGPANARSYLETALASSKSRGNDPCTNVRIDELTSSITGRRAKLVLLAGSYIPIDMAEAAMKILMKPNEYRFKDKKNASRIEKSIFIFNKNSGCLASEDVIIYAGEDYVNNNFIPNEERVA
jgi:hypothetical protein